MINTPINYKFLKATCWCV